MIAALYQLGYGADVNRYIEIAFFFLMRRTYSNQLFFTSNLKNGPYASLDFSNFLHVWSISEVYHR